MTKAELWIWAGVAAAVGIATGASALAGGNWLLPLVPLGIGWALWTLLCWADRRAERREEAQRDRQDW